MDVFKRVYLLRRAETYAHSPKLLLACLHLNHLDCKARCVLACASVPQAYEFEYLLNEKYNFGLTKSQIVTLMHAFDHNSDGLLDVDEVGAVLQSFGKPMTEAEVSGASGIGADEHAL